MNIQKSRLILVLSALLAVLAPPSKASIEVLPVTTTTFFDRATSRGSDSNGYPTYYLTYFGVFAFDQSDPSYIYKYGFGWLYNFGGTTKTSDDVYLYDFSTDDYFYTAANLYPYFYSFNKKAFLYYYADSSPREFHDFSTDSDAYYPVVDLPD